MSIGSMGDYKVLADTRTEEASLRLLRLTPGQEVPAHYHARSLQLYVVLAGRVRITLGEGSMETAAFEKVLVPRMTVHGLKATEPSLVLSINVPPLQVDDQLMARMQAAPELSEPMPAGARPAYADE